LKWVGERRTFNIQRSTSNFDKSRRGEFWVVDHFGKARLREASAAALRLVCDTTALHKISKVTRYRILYCVLKFKDEQYRHKLIKGNVAGRPAPVRRRPHGKPK